MDGVWHLNAPQWTDFESSPQIPDDDYFDRPHAELEPKALFVEEMPTIVVDKVSDAVEKESEPKLDASQSVENGVEPKLNVSEAYREKPNDDSLISEIEIPKMTPIKVISPRSRSKKDCPRVKEVTYDNVLTEAMASLQLSMKKKSRRSQAVKNTPSKSIATPSNADKILVSKTLSLLKGPRSTPSNPIPMWIRKTKPSEESGKENVQKNLLKEIVGEEEAKIEAAEPAEEPVEQPEPDTQNLDVVPIAVEALQLPQRKRGSNVSQRSVCSSNGTGTQARFSTCGLRRRSLTAYRRRSNKYISLAEAIRKFETGTPKRFRSVSTKNSKPGPVQKVKATGISATVPISPALRCKSRARPSTVVSKEERDCAEIEEAKKHSVRENVARAQSMKNLSTKPVAKKSSEDKIPKMNRESRVKVTVPSVVATEEGATVQEAEISNFGVPDITIAKATATKTKPFSFELRNKELQKKKENKIKELLSEEEKKTKVAFHARPVPTFKKPMIAGGSKEPGAKSMTKPCPFSFEARDKNVVKKKEEKMKIVLEEDKKARVFQAKPLPEFKPVLVRGVSKENLNSGNKPLNPSHKSRVSMLPVSRSNSRNCLLTRSVSNQENLHPSTKSQLPKLKQNDDKTETQKVLTEFHLNTDKRARERREFDERIRQKEQEIETLKKEAEAEKTARDEKERAEIRRMAETKARPMPAYKTPTIVHSDKPLTNPQSPGWAMKTKR